MKLTRRQLRKLIREMYSPNFEFMGMMSDIGSPMVKQLVTYLMPYRDRVRFEIDDAAGSIEINMYLHLIDKKTQKVSKKKVLIGTVIADFVGDMCANCYIVGLSGTLGGENRTKKVMFGFRDDLVGDDDSLFKYGNYGPILYELCLEVISRKDNTYMTCDKNSLEPAAYNVWAYYLFERSDVEKYQLDPMRIPREYRITPDDPSDDCDTGLPPTNDTAEEFYMNKTSRLIYPQGPDDDRKGMFKAYTDYLIEKDPIMKGYRKNSTPFLDLIENLGMII